MSSKIAFQRKVDHLQICVLSYAFLTFLPL